MEIAFVHIEKNPQGKKKKKNIKIVVLKFEINIINIQRNMEIFREYFLTARVSMTAFIYLFFKNFIY